MKPGYLSQYFKAVAAKRLSAVEANPEKSNQHELNGIQDVRNVLGTEDKVKMPALFFWFGNENEGISSEAWVTWYDSRKNQPHRSAEFRLYFPTTDVSEMFQEGDTIFVAQRTDDMVMMIVTESGSTVENQLYWLFGLKKQEDGVEVSSIEGKSDTEVDFVTRFILDELGIDAEEPENDILDELLAQFNGVFPTTLDFSKFARDSVKDVNALDDPDATLVAWLNQEEKLFLRLERHIISEKLKSGFVAEGNTDVEGFMSFSLGVHNRRKSRAGFSLEHHLAEIFTQHKIIFGKGHRTEKKVKPDFLFPEGKLYHDKNFPREFLTMLGAKTTCKDRWRQVLSEAAQIPHKHLLTLEPGISVAQTDEMQESMLQLVIPKSLHETYVDSQRKWLMNVKDFIGEVQAKQKKWYK